MHLISSNIMIQSIAPLLKYLAVVQSDKKLIVSHVNYPRIPEPLILLRPHTPDDTTGITFVTINKTSQYSVATITNEYNELSNVHGLQAVELKFLALLMQQRGHFIRVFKVRNGYTVLTTMTMTDIFVQKITAGIISDILKADAYFAELAITILHHEGVADLTLHSRLIEHAATYDSTQETIRFQDSTNEIAKLLYSNDVHVRKLEEQILDLKDDIEQLYEEINTKDNRLDTANRSLHRLMNNQDEDHKNMEQFIQYISTLFKNNIIVDQQLGGTTLTLTLTIKSYLSLSSSPDSYIRMANTNSGHTYYKEHNILDALNQVALGNLRIPIMAKFKIDILQLKSANSQVRNIIAGTGFETGIAMVNRHITVHNCFSSAKTEAVKAYRRGDSVAMLDNLVYATSAVNLYDGAVSDSIIRTLKVMDRTSPVQYRVDGEFKTITLGEYYEISEDRRRQDREEIENIAEDLF